jgi:exosortase/archaeosortase family protein
MRGEPAIVVFSLALLAICVDYALAPALNVWNPALFCGFLLLLLLRRVSSHSPRGVTAGTPGIARKKPRILVFFLLHLAAVIVFRWSPSSMANLQHGRIAEIAFAAAKYLVLLPTILLLPRAEWRRLEKLYRAEWIASSILLFTFFPYRLFSLIWPWYSRLLGRLVYAAAQPLVSGLAYVPWPAPTLLGPRLDVTIDFSCNGLQGVKLFQIIFAIILVLDWTLLNRRRALSGYFAGLAMMLAANAVRIVLLVALGNHISPDLILRYHVGAGWIFFAGAFLAYLLLAYNWLVDPCSGFDG